VSHLSRIKTRIADRELLVAALGRLGYEVQSGPATIRGMLGPKREVDLLVRVGSGWRALDVGFARDASGAYEIVADFAGSGASGSSLRTQLEQAQTEIEQLQREVRRQYALAATREKLIAQGFEVVEEESQADGQVRLLLRRMA